MAVITTVPMDGRGVTAERVETNGFMTELDFDLPTLMDEIRARLRKAGCPVAGALCYQERGRPGGWLRFLVHYPITDGEYAITPQLLLKTLQEIEDEVRAELQRRKVLQLLRNNGDEREGA